MSFTKQASLTKWLLYRNGSCMVLEVVVPVLLMF